MLVVLLIFFYSNKKDYTYLINEEAIPIRDFNEIKGMNYKVDIDDSINDKRLDIYSKIISSIYHYKDINNINDFFINLEIDSNYKIDDISIVDDNNYIIRNINYKKNGNKIFFNLKKCDFTNYNSNYDIKIKLKKNTRKI
jgi:hypothetical protein